MIKFQFPNIEREKPPRGKRSIVRTVYGNTNGYVSGRYWKTFGPTYDAGVEEEATDWLNERSDDE